MPFEMVRWYLYRILKAVVSFTKRVRKANNELYIELSNVFSVLNVKRLNWTHVEEKAGVEMPDANMGKKAGNMTYVNQLRRDSGLSAEELKNIMDRRELMEILFNDVRACLKYVKSKLFLVLVFQ